MASYALDLSEAEIRRYQLMAERAHDGEAELWRRAGIGPGAVVADVGCGPAAISVVLARAVQPAGHVIGVERDPAALAAGQGMVAGSGLDNVELRAGSATDTGIGPGTVDVAMCRHVLAHNGPDEQRIVDHLARICRPGGVVYLVDVDATAIRMIDTDPDLADLGDRYAQFHRRRGNDLQPGLRLSRLLASAGLEVLAHQGNYDIVQLPPGLRPPSWAAREAMLAEGVVSAADVARWEAAFTRMDAAPVRPTLFAPQFVGLGRRPG